MQPRNLILVSGFERGGTNILWNLICSHPGVLTTGRELNEICSRRFGLSTSWKLALEASVVPRLPCPGWIVDLVGDRIVSFAEQHALESWGRYKTSTAIYDHEEMSSLPICTKSVSTWPPTFMHGLLQRNYPLKYNYVLRKAFERVKVIYLIRDGEALCNGWMRRGCSPYLAGVWYRRIISGILSDQRSRPQDISIINFREVLEDPFGLAQRLYAFLELEDLELEEYHLKSKQVLSAEGSHEVRLGSVNQMLWVPRSEIDQYLDRRVDETQRTMLSEDQRTEFLRGSAGIQDTVTKIFTNSSGRSL
jgi:hypothetical protein